MSALKSSKCFCAAFLSIGLAAASAHAQLTSDVLFRTGTYTQTGSGSTVLDHYDLSSRAVMASAGEFTTATLSYPGPGSPAAYTGYNAAGPYLSYQSVSYATQAALTAAYPTGTYTTTAENTSTGPTQTTSLQSSSATDYPLTVPTLTASSYAQLQDANAAAPITLTFDSLSPAAGITTTLVYLYVENPAGQVVYNPGNLPGSTTAITIPAGTLQPGTAYTDDLYFSDRILSTAADGVTDTLAFANVTQSPLITASVPEPVGLAIVGIGLSLCWRRRSRA